MDRRGVRASRVRRRSPCASLACAMCVAVCRHVFHASHPSIHPSSFASHRIVVGRRRRRVVSTVRSPVAWMREEPCVTNEVLRVCAYSTCMVCPMRFILVFVWVGVYIRGVMVVCPRGDAMRISTRFHSRAPWTTSERASECVTSERARCRRLWYVHAREGGGGGGRGGRRTRARTRDG